ncbi:MAG: hypothetical protein MUF83_10645 [Acidimicrobiales bacterium]|nr:hypothetical protein [Acidimicrobiales bacterium]
MTRDQLEHVLRAAARIVEVHDLVVIGSQAVLASYPHWQLPREATRSVEADVAVDAELARLDVAIDETELADRIDGAIGEGSRFHQTHGTTPKASRPPPPCCHQDGGTGWSR